MNNYRALLIGHSEHLMKAIPRLLDRAGFDVDVITSASRFDRDHVCSLTYVAEPAQLVPIALVQDVDSYDLIVIGDDHALREIVAADVPASQMLKLLPVCSEENFLHIGSKLGLSAVLKKAGIPTPEFQIAHDELQLTTLLSNLTSAVMIKIDQSGGGSGVFRVDPKDSSTTENLKKQALVYPLLIQEHIEGDLLDLSGFYQHGELICTTYSTTDAVVSNAYGPSSLRTYTQLCNVPEAVFDMLRDLGRALGAHGFVNIACLRERSTDRYYIIEADMRATVWADYGRYLGDDHAIAIKRYFDKGHTLDRPYVRNADFPLTLQIPFIFRLTPWQILRNWHRVWSFCDGYKKSQVMRYVLAYPIRALIHSLIAQVKPRVSQDQWNLLRSGWHMIKGLRRRYA